MTVSAAQPYAVMLNVAGRLAVVVGNGPGAVRAAKSLMAHGADVVIIGPDATNELVAMESVGELSLEARPYAAGDLDGAFIAIAASDSAETDAEVAEEARERGVLVSVSSDAGASDFILPSVVRRGALQIAVTTGGGAPSVAREVRRCIADAYGQEWEGYTRLVAGVRVLGIERMGLSDAEMAPLFDAVESSSLRSRLQAGEKITPEQVFEEHSAVLGLGESS